MLFFFFFFFFLFFFFFFLFSFFFFLGGRYSTCGYGMVWCGVVGGKEAVRVEGLILFGGGEVRSAGVAS